MPATTGGEMAGLRRLAAPYFSPGIESVAGPAQNPTILRIMSPYVVHSSDSIFISSVVVAAILIHCRIQTRAVRSEFAFQGEPTTFRVGGKFMSRVMSVLLFFGVAVSPSFAAPPSKDLTFTDLSGQSQTPLSTPEAKATVLFFILPDCPISNAYAPEIKRITEDYTKKNVSVFMVYVDPDLTEAEAKKHAIDFGYVCPVIRDTSLQLVAATGVTIAPEVVVLGPDGKRRYRGRIDNLYAGLGKRRSKASEHNLRDALDATLSGMPVLQETTTAIGCYIAKPSTAKPSP